MLPRFDSRNYQGLLRMKNNLCDEVSGMCDAVRASEVPRWKRVLDISCVVLAMPMLAVIAALVALAIKCVSRGPLLFRQERVGLNGRVFECLKFRSMQVGADATAHRNHLAMLMRSETPMTKLDRRRDHRLIPGGALLRATGLDELPQLINVLRGEMSLVGPRPCTPYESAQYEPWQWERFSALPGLTGLWQVSGKNRTTFNQMIRLDIEYARRQSLGLDLRIMLRTLPALVQQVVESGLPEPESRPVPGTTVASKVLY
jgi:lipopolysaccharide/colanic/teichoic acid biosynthesis glycosyltransferase